jgi:hypothetical protein
MVRWLGLMTVEILAFVATPHLHKSVPAEKRIQERSPRLQTKEKTKEKKRL